METHQPKLIRAREGAKRFGVSVSTWWNWNNPKSRHYRPDFPEPVKVSANTTAWLESEVNEYMESLVKTRDTQTGWR